MQKKKSIVDILSKLEQMAKEAGLLSSDGKFIAPPSPHADRTKFIAKQLSDVYGVTTDQFLAYLALAGSDDDVRHMYLNEVVEKIAPVPAGE